MGKRPVGRKCTPLLYCPHPNCGHFGLIITKFHCRDAHNMEREELFKLYGAPKSVDYDVKKRNENAKMKTIHANNGQFIAGRTPGMR